MADPLLWATAIIAGASLIFAFIAFRQVMRSTSLVAAFIQRADKFLNTFQTSAKGIFTPKFIADTLERTLTSGLTNEDGSQVTMPQYVNGYLQAYGPSIYMDLKKEIPTYLPILLNPEAHLPPNGPQNPGTALVNQRWHGSGGLKAATGVAKAAKTLPFGQKIAGYVEGAQALVGLGASIRELKKEVFPGNGGNGAVHERGASSRTNPGSIDWGPPF